VGANVGRAKAKIDDGQISSGLLQSGFATTAMDDRKRDTGFKLFTGYQFNRYVALEGGYFDLGRFGFTATTLPAGTLAGQARFRGLDLDLAGFLPIAGKFSAFGRAGLTDTQTRDSFQGTGMVTVTDAAPRKTALNYTFGGGLQYDLTRKVAFRAEVERYRVDDAVGNRGDIDLLSVGVLYRFGGGDGSARPVADAGAAAQAEPEAMAAPVRVVVPVPVPVRASTQEYCTILDLQFDIDHDEIQREDKEKLAVLGTFLARYPDTTAVIEGHSDNVGSDDHNLRLSRERAQSVVAYLVGTLRIDASRLSAVGYGDTRPVADNRTEEGKRRNRRIDAVVACVTDVQGLTVAPARMTMAMIIDFGPNQAEIKPEYDGQLRKVADFLRANPAVTATVEGHTGNLQTTPVLAMAISTRRAQNVVDYLVEHLGIDRSRLAAEGYGDNRRFAYNTSAEGEQENRRVNIIIDYPTR
jgi:OOP family OmpA-OmpF porin